MISQIFLSFEKEKAKKWLKDFDRNSKTNTYMFDDDGENLIIHVSGNVDISNHPLEKIPYRFGSIDGSFDAQNCRLTSLTNSPYEVKGDFIIRGNPLRTLMNSPEYIGRNFDIQDCPQLTSFLYGPNEVIGSYISSGNLYLKLINKIPTKMGRFFHIITDKKQSLLGLESEYLQTPTHFVFQCLGSKMEHFIAIAIKNKPNILTLDSGSFGMSDRFYH